MTRATAMPVDVPIPIDSQNGKAHGWPSVGVLVDAPILAQCEAPCAVIKSWSAQTVFGDLAQTWDRLLQGNSIEDHARLAGKRQRALNLARLATATLAVERDAAIVVGTSKGSIEEWISPPPPTSTSDKPLTRLSTAGLADIASALAADLGTRGPLLTLSAACASGLHALIRATMMIRSREVRQALVVATEASVHPLFVGSFQRLGVLARPGEGCRPFDRNRTGFYMSEAACAVLLEAHDPADGTPANSIVVENFALGGDATHLTGGDPDGRLLRHLVEKVVAKHRVDLVHAHGTGTVLNDETELAAIDDVVGTHQPAAPVVYSHKAALGHSLGASGLLSVVLSCMCHTTGIIPPNVRTTEPLPAGRVRIPNVTTRQPVRRSLAIAAGFGGPTAVVSLASR
jgi:3-oxoacyl-[acyl-carrier-protein] synthase II